MWRPEGTLHYYYYYYSFSNLANYCTNYSFSSFVHDILRILVDLIVQFKLVSGMTRQLRFDPTKDIGSWRLTRFVDGSSISLDSLLRFFLSSSAKDLSVAWIRLAGGLVEYCRRSRNHPSKEATLCWEEGVSLDRVRLDRLRSEQIVRVPGQSEIVWSCTSGSECTDHKISHFSILNEL